VLKQKRVDADADQSDPETRSETEAQTIDLQRRGQPLPQRLARLNRSSEWNRACPDARKSQSQLLLLRLPSCWVLQIPPLTCSTSIGLNLARDEYSARGRKWPRRDLNLAAQAVSLRLQQQLKSILSPEPRGAPPHPKNGPAFRYGLRSVTAILPILNDIWIGNRDSVCIFRRGVSVLDLWSAKR
jgi:hypothetical protein